MFRISVAFGPLYLPFFGVFFQSLNHPRDVAPGSDLGCTHHARTCFRFLLPRSRVGISLPKLSYRPKPRGLPHGVTMSATSFVSGCFRWECGSFSPESIAFMQTRHNLVSPLRSVLRLDDLDRRQGRTNMFAPRRICPPLHVQLHPCSISLTISRAGGAHDGTIQTVRKSLQLPHSTPPTLSVTPITPAHENGHCQLFCTAQNGERNYV